MERITDEDVERDEILEEQFQKEIVFAGAKALTDFVCKMIYDYAEFQYNELGDLKKNLNLAKQYIQEEIEKDLNNFKQVKEDEYMSGLYLYFTNSEASKKEGLPDRWHVVDTLIETYLIDEKFFPQNVYFAIDDEDLKNGCFDIYFEYPTKEQENDLFGTVYYELDGKIIEIFEYMTQTKEPTPTKENYEIILGKIISENENIKMKSKNLFSNQEIYM